MRKLPTRKLLTVLIAGVLFVPTTGFTLGLGEIEVNSALNQRLNAEIELLSAEPEDTENIIVKLASRKEFSRAGLDRPYLLNDLRFKSEIIDGVAHIKVSSGSPIREPFINFLIEIDWPNGHLLREYTVLLDPPVFMTQAAKTTSVQSTDNSDFRPTTSASTNISPVVVAPAVTSSPRPTAAKAAAPVSSEPTFIPAPVVQQQTPTKQSVASYRVKSGDTAWSIADAMRPNQNISVPQMLMAMLRANPESFINGNINGLKRGYIIRTPDAAQIAAISHEDARAMVREHGALWRQYQQSRSGVQSASSIPADSKPAQIGSSTNSASAATGKDNAHLAIVAGAGTSTVGDKAPANMSAEELRAELALSRERVETERVEKEALRNRVDVLEQRTVKMESMLSIEDEELSAVQSLNAPVAADSMDTAATDTANVEMAESALSGSAEMDEDAVTDESAAPEAATEETGAVTEKISADVSPEDAIFTDEVSGQSEDANASDIAATPEAAEPVANNTDSEPVADPLTELLNNPTLLAAAGGGLLLFVLMIALINKRRKVGSSMAAVPVPSNANTDTDLENLADDIAEEKAVTEAMTEVTEEENTDVAASAEDSTAELTEAVEVAEVETDVEAEEARDDIIAEADVYLAYGIYQQAEDLLKQALVDHPENDTYRAKLAETFYSSKNANAFLEVANELKQNVDDDSPVWAKVSEMGQELCGNDPMFQGAMVGDLDLDEAAPSELSMDFGSDNDGATEELSEINLDDDSIELPDLDIEEQSVEVVDESSLVADDEISEIPNEPVEEIEFDLSDTEATVEEAASEDEFLLDIDTSELDIKDEDEVIDEASAEEESFDIADIEIDLDEEISASEVSDTDVDFNLDDAVEAEAEAETEVEALEDDSEEIALDLSDDVEIESLDSDSTDNIDAVLAANDDSAEDGDFDLSSLDDTDEISTKLDLARAYMDMGDHDGTRDILDEVLADGNDDQKQEANDLMQKLN